VKSLRFLRWIIIFSFFSALLLSLIPLTPIVELFYPLCAALVLIYWFIVFPEHVNLTFAWILGLLIDVLYGNYLGEHALALSILAVLSAHFHLQFRMFPLAQQMFFIFVLLTIYQGLLFWMQVCLGFAVNFYLAGFALLTSALVWPFLKKVLRAPL